MSALRLVHRIVSGLFAVLGLILILFFATKAFQSVPVVEGVDYGWGEVAEAVASATEPAEYSDFDYSTDGGPEMVDEFAGDNGFVASTGLQMLAGLLGLGLMYTALAQRPSGRWVILHLTGLAGIVIFGFWLFGFNLAYPGGFALGGFLPESLGGPFLGGLDDDLFGYGMAFTIWTDFFYQSLYAVLAASLVLSLCAGQFRSPTVMGVAMVIGTLAFPLTTSWLWGGGWLSSINAMDFAGSAMVHMLAGSAALGLIVLGRVCPPAGPGFFPMPGSRPAGRPTVDLSPAGWVMFVVGCVIFVGLIVGVNAGSVLSNDTPVVAAVLNATGCAVAGGMITAGLLAFVLARRPRVMVVTVGALAGWAAICAPADAVTSAQAFGIGAVAGGFGAGVVYVFDRFGFDDPFGVVAISFVGGGVGMFATGLVSEDASLAAQVMAGGSIAAVGFAVGGSLGLIAWLARSLCEPPQMQEPELDPPAAQPSGASDIR